MDEYICVERPEVENSKTKFATKRQLIVLLIKLIFRRRKKQ